MKGELFRGVMQWDFFKEDLGRAFKLPVFYYDNTAMTAVFTASTRKVKQYLPDPEMHPVEMFPGRCLVAFSAFEYRNTDIDPYNEFSISILISYGRRPSLVKDLAFAMLSRTFTTYVWHLPVTTEIARYGGVEMYGYPKFIADIEFTRTEDSLQCTLSEGGEHILTLVGKKLATAPGKRLRFKTYSVKEGVSLAANVLTDPAEFAQTLVPGAARLTLGDSHPISQQLREIGLSSGSKFYQYMPQTEMILFGARNLVDE
ncbi:MAG: acetoacetate decarboxylase family protein [Bradymonadales bacterium]|nr:acetoacetate decarboxylase family protein [Bradymonadales bacterium]